MGTRREGGTLRICVDCLMLLANGEVFDGDGNDITEEHVQKVVDNLGEFFDVTLGCVDPDCADDGDECGFSWQWCDMCESHLGGDRYHATLWVTVEEGL